MNAQALAYTPNQTKIFDTFGITVDGVVMVCNRFAQDECDEWTTIIDALPVCSDITDITITSAIELHVDYDISKSCLLKGQEGYNNAKL